MKLKIVLFTALLMFVVLTGMLLYKSSSLLSGIEDELITYLEDNYHIKVEVKERSLWPLNQIALRDVEIGSENNDYSLSIPEVNIYYDIMTLFTNPEKAIDYISLSEPVIDINGSIIDNYALNEEFSGQSTADNKDEGSLSGVLAKLDAISPMQIRVDNGQLIYLDGKDSFQLLGLNLLLNSRNQEDRRIQIDTGFYTDNFKLGDYELKGLELNKIKLLLSSDKEEWQLKLETDYNDISDLAALLQNKEGYLSSLEGYKGLIKGDMFFQGNGLKLNDYNGTLSIKNGSVNINGADYQDRIPAVFDISPEDKFVKIQEINGQLAFNSDNHFSSNDLEFAVNRNLFKLNGRIDFLSNGITDIFGHLRASQLDINCLNIVPERLKVDGLVALDYTVEGSASDLNMNLDISLADGKINDLDIANLAGSIRYYQGNIYLDQLNFTINDTNQFSMGGVYTNNSKEYSFDIESRNLNLTLMNSLDRILKSDFNYPDIKGAVNFSANVTGRYPGIGELNASGEVEVINPVIRTTQDNKGEENTNIQEELMLNRLSSNFYLSDNKLLFQKGTAAADWGELSFSGEIGLAERALNIKVNSDSINISKFIFTSWNLPGGFSENDITGECKIDADIQGSFDMPLVQADIKSPEGSFRGYRYDNLQADLLYEKDGLTISEFALSYNETPINGNGSLDMTGTQPELSTEIRGNSVSYDLINRFLIEEGILNEMMPVSGNLNLVLGIKGSISEPSLSIKLGSNDTVLSIKDKKITVDSINIRASKTGKDLVIDHLALKSGDAYLNGNGTISAENLAINYHLNNLSINEFMGDYIDERYNMDGNIELLGDITGELSKPRISANVNIKDISYQEKAAGSINGEVVYSTDKLELNGFKWKNSGNEYIIDGEITDIFNQPALYITLDTEEGSVQNLVFIDLTDEIQKYNLNDYYFTGTAVIKGRLDNLLSWTNINIINHDKPDENINVSGTISSELDLSIKGHSIEISRFLRQYTEQDVAGLLELDGNLTGKINRPELTMSTRMSDIAFGEVSLKEVQGEVEITEGSSLSFDQNLLFSENSSLEVQGLYPFEKGLKGLDLNLKFERFPLQLLSVYNTVDIDMSGFLSGNAEWHGGLDNPMLAGNLAINNGGLDLGLPEGFNKISAKVDLAGSTVSINDMSGKYGDGKFVLSGSIKPFDKENNWNLILKGDNIPFDYGSFKGRIDPDMNISGTFNVPFIKGDILTHDFIVGMPFKWPLSDSNSSLIFDFALHPGKEVYISSKDTINVLVQEGDLNISNKEGQLVFNGKLTSKQGVFDFYNNKFILEKGTATFERNFDNSKGYIPELNVSAWTNVGGTRVSVKLNGKADNMVTTFTSSPPLSQDEILTLLTSKGGLGEFASGDLDNVVQSELYRLIYNQLQLDFVDNIQEQLKNIFNLDRLEVDTYNLGWNNQLSVYVGKYLNKRLYLEYNDIIITDNADEYSDIKGELSLQYLINDNLSFETSWQGDNDYSFSFETNLEF